MNTTIHPPPFVLGVTYSTSVICERAGASSLFFNAYTSDYTFSASIIRYLKASTTAHIHESKINALYSSSKYRSCSIVTMLMRYLRNSFSFRIWARKKTRKHQMPRRSMLDVHGTLNLLTHFGEQIQPCSRSMCNPIQKLKIKNPHFFSWTMVRKKKVGQGHQSRLRASCWTRNDLPSLFSVGINQQVRLYVLLFRFLRCCIGGGL